MKKRKKIKKFNPHIDSEWISGKIGIHGGSYYIPNYRGLAKIGYIGNKNRIQVFGYNMILILKYLKRKLNQ